MFWGVTGTMDMRGHFAFRSKDFHWTRGPACAKSPVIGDNHGKDAP
jgi:hypothetical protein